MSESKPLKFRWWSRLQIEFGISFKLFPNRDLTWRQWAFDPNGGITYPGQAIDRRWQLPESTSWEVDTTMITYDERKTKRFYSRVLWIHGAIRVLGIDVGAGLYFRPSPIVKVTT